MNFKGHNSSDTVSAVKSRLERLNSKKGKVE